MSEPTTQVAPFWYAKKPVVISAMRFDGSQASAEAIEAWAADVDDESPIEHITEVDGSGAEVHRVLISTLEGVMAASPGDFVIRGLVDEFYPCKPDVFERSYELAAPGQVPEL